MTITGSEILAKSLKRYGVDTVFFILGGPMGQAEESCADEGIRMIDVRHEQAGAMMATGYTRIARKPSVCMGASGPGAINLTTGIAHAWADGAPVIALGGSSDISSTLRGGFQEVDQVAIFKPITRWSERVYSARRIPEYIDKAFRIAMGAPPGPVYLDFPGDVLDEKVEEDRVLWMDPQEPRRPAGDPAAIEQALEILAAAEKPVIVSGSGILWSRAEGALKAFVEKSGIPFWTTPQGRGVIPEDHPLSFIATRSHPFGNCDAIVQVGTRQNYVVGYMRSPRWNKTAKLIQIDIDPEELGRNRRPTVGIVGDAKAVLEQLVAADKGRLKPAKYKAWVDSLREENTKKLAETDKEMSTDADPIHPLRLCKEVRDWLPRDAVLAIDGREILDFGRQSIPFYAPVSLNSGTDGCMGVGLPLGIGAQIADPKATVVVLHGDGSFGMNGMEMDTAVRHNLPVICIISNNGGWTARRVMANGRARAGRDLRFTRYDLMFKAMEIDTWNVEKAKDIRPALDAALKLRKPALINVMTDPAARAPGEHE